MEASETAKALEQRFGDFSVDFDTVGACSCDDVVKNKTPSDRRWLEGSHQQSYRKRVDESLGAVK